jgi:hypothetical protein
MPGELKPLVRGWQHTRSNGVDLWRSDGCIAACAGAGVSAAAQTFTEVGSTRSSYLHRLGRRFVRSSQARPRLSRLRRHRRAHQREFFTRWGG